MRRAPVRSLTVRLLRRAGPMADQDELRKLVDRDGVSLPDAFCAYGVDLDRALDAHSQLEAPQPTSSSTSSRAPCSSRSTCPSASCSARSGSSAGASRGRGRRPRGLDADGQAPRRPRGRRKARARDPGRRRETGDGAVCTSGGVVCRPGIVTSVVETAEQLLDQRHLDAGKLASMLAQAQELSRGFAEEEQIDVGWEKIGRSSRSCRRDADRVRRRGDPRGRGHRRAASPLGRSTTRRRSRAPASQR